MPAKKASEKLEKEARNFRVAVYLTEEEHRKYKVRTTELGKSMQADIYEHVLKVIESKK